MERIKGAQAGMGAQYFRCLTMERSLQCFLYLWCIYERAHHREIEGFGGLASQMPVYTGITAVVFFGWFGLPGFLDSLVRQCALSEHSPFIRQL
ncbi:hypothetical protein Ct9H90mP29_09690 [bacterium]|nr:MAG: hypothetical protein Ct9H90mP29_09690 [bacterium]